MPLAPLSLKGRSAAAPDALSSFKLPVRLRGVPGCWRPVAETEAAPATTLSKNEGQSVSIHAEWYRQTLGWLRRASARTSRSTRCAATSDCADEPGRLQKNTRLIAYSVPSRMLRARKTAPPPPWPRRSSSVNSDVNRDATANEPSPNELAAVGLSKLSHGDPPGPDDGPHVDGSAAGAPRSESAVEDEAPPPSCGRSIGASSSVRIDTGAIGAGAGAPAATRCICVRASAC